MFSFSYLNFFMCDTPPHSVIYGDPGRPPSRQRRWRTKQRRGRREGNCQGGIHRKQPYLHGETSTQEAPQVHTTMCMQNTSNFFYVFNFQDIIYSLANFQMTPCIKRAGYSENTTWMGPWWWLFLHFFLPVCCFLSFVEIYILRCVI